MSIQNNCLLLKLTIHQWTAKVREDRVKELVATHFKTESHSDYYTKSLIRSEYLQNIRTCANALRYRHDKLTLPWMDGGVRIIPNTAFFDYQEDIQKNKDAFTSAVDNFITLYPRAIEDAKNSHGELFDPDDYPQEHELRSMFRVETDLLPIPGVADFRVELSEEDMKRFVERQHKAISAIEGDLVRELHDTLNRIWTSSVRLKTGYTLAGSQITEATNRIRKYNINNNPALEALCTAAVNIQSEEDLVQLISRCR